MTSQAVLDALAERYGIESEFVDALGARQHTPPQTKRALLTALGVGVEDGAEQQALAALEAAEWDRPLPPVLVAICGAIRVPLALQKKGSAEVAWRLRLETGGERAGRVRPEELALLATAECGDQTFERRELALPADIPLGYHRLTIGSDAAEMTLIVAPEKCWLPPAIESDARLGGIAVQLYLLRSRDNWGIGDFTDLRNFVELVAAHGLDVIGLNPLHEMFVDDPEHASPYSPASRLLLNVLNIGVSAIPEFATCTAAQARVCDADFVERLRGCRAAALVDYSGVSALKLDVLRLVYAAFVITAPPGRQAEFAAYRAASPRSIQRTHVFIALREHFAAQDPELAAWRAWPSDYRDPESAAVGQFATEHADEIGFIAWLQWVAVGQLADAARAAGSMRVGLYRDLAVGADAGGAETWSNQRAVVAAASVGAPPDIYNTAGQNWGLPPFHPQALREEAYRSFIELVRANMLHAGGLRIDHVMALQHLYWIPLDAAAADGAYVRYPLDDLVGILALESQRAQCLVVGEDLGTVPAGFRERMAASNILSYRVLFFERETAEAGAFIAPDAYPKLALAVLGSHDLPTLGAWWNGADIRLRKSLGLLTDDAAAGKQRRERGRDRDALVAALQVAGALQPDKAVTAEDVFRAAHQFLAATTAALAVAQIDDLTDEIEPVNVPTTSDEHPNWRRRLSRTIEELPGSARFQALVALLDGAGRLRPEKR